MPESEDVRKFATFLSKEVKKSLDILKQQAAVQGIKDRSMDYRRAQNVALAKLTYFNKRRPGETEQLP